MAWRLAKSLVTLRDEVHAVHPGTTFWTIGDQAHRNTWSDHNPNASDVVCAADVLGNAGLDLAAFAEAIRTSNHPAFKYVIFNRRIASKGGGWRPYYGSNPHATHVHVSVGVGPDGRSTGPYDDTSPWGISADGGDDMIGLKRGDTGERVKHLQGMLREAGHDPGTVDGVYGPATSRAVLAMRVAQGSGVDSGDSISGWAATQLHVAVAKAHGGGERGPAGPPGEPGKTPTKVRLELTGNVVEAS